MYDCYTQTLDSFVFMVNTEDYYSDMDLTKYDTSNYSKDYSCFSEQNKKVVRLSNDEGVGKPILKFVALQ